jgi:ureidoglycolate dehydrogenase (NAD+)
MMPKGRFAQRVETLIEEIHQAPRAAGVERLFVPGEMEWERHARAMAQGIPLPPDVLGSLQEAAEMAGLNFEDL